MIRSSVLPVSSVMLAAAFRAFPRRAAARPWLPRRASHRPAAKMKLLEARPDRLQAPRHLSTSTAWTTGEGTTAATTGRFRSILEFENCYAYLMHRLDGGAAVPTDAEWDKILEEITETLPAREMAAFSWDDEEKDSERFRRMKARRKSKLSRDVLRDRTRDAFVLQVCGEHGWLAAAASYALHARGRMTEANWEFALRTVSNAAPGPAVEGEAVEGALLELCRSAEEYIKALPEGQPQTRLRWWLVAVMAKTSRWEDALRTRHQISPPSQEPSPETNEGGSHNGLTALALRAMAEGRAADAWSCLDDPRFHQNRSSLRDEPRDTLDDLWTRWIGDFCRAGDREGLSGLLEYFGRIGYFARAPVVEALEEEQGRPGAMFSLDSIRINQNGTCLETDAKLPSSELTEAELDEVLRATVGKVLKGKDVYQTTTPKELRRFNQELESAPDYDVVIDGLNVALGDDKNCRTNNDRGNRLLAAVDHLVTRGYRPLLISRHHIRSYRQFRAVERKVAGVITFENISEDDPFLIAATMHGGPACRFLSNDALRQHSHRLRDARTRGLFTRWQARAQVRHNVVTPADKRRGRFEVYLTWPPLYELRCQLAGGAWHLPLANKKEMMRAHQVVPPERWLALRFRQQ